MKGGSPGTKARRKERARRRRYLGVSIAGAITGVRGNEFDHGRRGVPAGQGVTEQRIVNGDGLESVGRDSARAAGEQLFIRIEGIHGDAEIASCIRGTRSAIIGQIDDGVTSIEVRRVRNLK